MVTIIGRQEQQHLLRFSQLEAEEKKLQIHL